MENLPPIIRSVKFCAHHGRMGTTDKIADFLYSCVQPLEEIGIEVVHASLGCGCRITVNPLKRRALPRKTPSVGPRSAGHESGTKGRAAPTEVESLPLPFGRK